MLLVIGTNQHSLCFVETLDLLLTCLATVILTGKSPIIEWFDAIDETEYFSDTRNNFNSTIIDPIYALLCLISLAFLDLGQDFSLKGANPDSYIHKPEYLLHIDTVIHSKLIELPAASPIVLGWSSVLHRISIRLTEKLDDQVDAFLQQITNSPSRPTTQAQRTAMAEKLAKYAEQLASTSLEFRALDLTPELFRVLPQRLDYANIVCVFVQACLPYVNMTEAVAQIVTSIISPFPELIDIFFSDPFADRALLLSKAKVPLSMRPFVLLCKCLGADAYEFISTMTGYMLEIPSEFQDYEFVSKSSTVVRLLSDLVVDRSLDEDGIVIPSGTRGNLIIDGARTLVLWSMNYNGWPYFARVLEQAEAARAWDARNLDILDLITSTLNAMDENKGNELLSILSTGVTTEDFIELALKIYDSALLLQKIEVCISCTKFLTALVRVNPHRVWPYLGRSRLLERNGKPSLMSNLMGSVEIVSNNFDFTLSIILFVEILVMEAIAESLEEEINVSMKMQILSQFTKHFLEVYESFAYWRYARQAQRVEIGTAVTRVFSTILRTCFRVEDNVPLGDKIVSVLAPSAELLLGAFLTPNKVAMRTLEPILGGIESIAKTQNPLDSTDTVMSEAEMKYAEVSLRFCSLLIRIRSILRLPSSLLETKVYASAPDLVQIFVRYFNLHAVVMEVQEAAVAGYWPEDQPSLLAHLGTKHSQMLITGLMRAVENELERESSLITISSFFAAVVGSQQEGLCTLLISGRDTRKGPTKVESERSLLSVLEKQVAFHWKDFDTSVLVPVLNAIALAHNTWTLSTSSSLQALNKALLRIIIDNFEVKIPEKQAEQDAFLNNASHNLVTSKAVNILAIQLFKSPDNLGKEILDFLESNNNLEVYSKKYFSVHGFRASLHGNLHRNFDRKWPEGKLVKSAKSDHLSPRIYSASYLYDLGLLDSILGRDVVWHGFRREVVEANINLSYIDSQLLMIQAWTSFLTSLTLHVVKRKNEKVLQSLRSVASLAISASLNEALQYPEFQATVKRRLDTAFFILFNASKLSMDIYSDYDLERSYALLTDPSLAFLKLLNGVDQPNDKSYEPLLKILSLLLDALVKKRTNGIAKGGVKELNSSVSGSVIQGVVRSDGSNSGSKSSLYHIINGIVDMVAVKGMKTIVSAIDTRKDSGAVEDIVQITSILKKCLELPGIAVLHTNLMSMMSDVACERTVLSLYSYSLELSVNGDPVFGELALYYIQEWLKLGAMADHFVINGLFGVLNQSPLSKRIQRGGINPGVAPRLHSIWTKGILSTILMLLRQLGSRIVPGVLLFLNYFRDQIDFALRSWTEPSLITLSMINETSQILVLLDVVTKICESDQISHIPEFISNAELLEAFDYLLIHGRYLASMVAATNAEDQKLAMERVADGGNALVDKVVMEMSELRDSLEEEMNL